MKTLIYTILAVLCFLHIYRDYLQIKFGYKHNFITSFLHFWDAPRYEVPGMVVFFLLGCLFAYLAGRP